MSEACPACQSLSSKGRSCWRHVVVEPPADARQPILSSSTGCVHTAIFGHSLVSPGASLVMHNLSVCPGFLPDEAEWTSGDSGDFTVDYIMIGKRHQLITPVSARFFSSSCPLQFEPCKASTLLSVKVTNISAHYAVASFALRGPVIPSNSPTPIGWRTYPVKP